MSNKSEPVVKKQKRKESWVSVSFIPDWSMFNMESLTDYHIQDNLISPNYYLKLTLIKYIY